MNATRVKLLWVEGEDADEFADMIGALAAALKMRCERVAEVVA